MTISAWNSSVSLDSPDGVHTATIKDACELGMGAPTCGELIISNGMEFDSCNPSIVWSDDSRFLAVPQWNPDDRDQRLMIVSMEHHKSQYAAGIFSVLELESFSDGVVRGINSPAYRPIPIEVDMSEIDW